MGGIYTNGTLTAVDSTVSDNSAANGWGGAILSESGATTTVTGSTLGATNVAAIILADIWKCQDQDRGDAGVTPTVVPQ